MFGSRQNGQARNTCIGQEEGRRRRRAAQESFDNNSIIEQQGLPELWLGS